MKKVEMRISEMLREAGVPASLKGYYFLRTAVGMVTEKPELIHAVTKELYPTVARQYDTTPSRVERAIRHAFEVAWDRGDVEVLNKYFGYTVSSEKGKPTNSEFIATFADILSFQIEAK